LIADLNIKLEFLTNHGIMTTVIKLRETGSMSNIVSKSKFKPNALRYFRDVERTKQELIITDRGRSVLKIIPYSEDVNETMKSLRNSVIKYEDPFAPVGLDDWETLK